MLNWQNETPADPDTYQRQCEARYSRPRAMAGRCALRAAITCGLLLDVALFAAAYALMGLGGVAVALAGALFVLAIVAAFVVALAGMLA